MARAGRFSRAEVSQAVLRCVADFFIDGIVDERMTWREVGWHDDSLDESAFLTGLESLLNVDLVTNPELLRPFYAVDSPIGDLVDALHEHLS